MIAATVVHKAAQTFKDAVIQSGKFILTMSHYLTLLIGREEEKPLKAVYNI